MNTKFMKLVDGSPKEIPASDVFSGKKVVVCGVPGALTPTCSEQVSSDTLVELCRNLYSGHADVYLNCFAYFQHLPGFIDNVDKFKQKVGWLTDRIIT